MKPKAPGAVISSSPPNGDDIETDDTPLTNVTGFTSGTSGNGHATQLAAPSFGLSIPLESLARAFHGLKAIRGDDIFVTPAAAGGPTQLSPTAESFTPKTDVTPRPSYNNLQPIGTPVTVVPAHAGTQTAAHVHTQGRVNVAGSATCGRNAFTAAANTSGVPSDETSTVDYHLSALYNDMSRIPLGVQVQDYCANIMGEPFSTDEKVTRAFAIMNCAVDYPWVSLATLFKTESFPSLQEIDCSAQASRNVVIVVFGDISDMKQAYCLAKRLIPAWNLQLITPRQIAVHRGVSDISQVTDYEGQLLISVHHQLSSQASPDRDQDVVIILLDCLTTFGSVKALRALPIAHSTIHQYRAEFFNAVAAEKACVSLKGTIIKNIVIQVQHYTPDVVPAPPVTQARSPSRVQDQVSVTGRSIIPAGVDPGYPHRVRALLSTRTPPRSLAHGVHNQIYINRIERGEDVRTTIMLRNIPNRVDAAALREILDETSFGAYDFSYLRIDFQNNCNVGYAFINFADPLAIVPFALARAGHRWDRFNSDKVAEISYATIQGRDCLIQKFRNSSVMLEDPAYRPKLFITGNGPDAGTEEPFPPPDNISKMRRSMENAEHIGLFAPRQGQAYREEQRRRRSQYDRGTPGAEYEMFGSYNRNHRQDPALSPRHLTHPRDIFLDNDVPSPRNGDQHW